MLQASWPHSRRDLPSLEEAILPAARDHAPVHPLHQDDTVGYRETYYACPTRNAQMWSETSTMAWTELSRGEHWAWPSGSTPRCS
jgi:hypothetical protein